MQNTFVIVSHDMGVHYQITDRMVIMYAGNVAEIAETEVIFERPAASLHGDVDPLAASPGRQHRTYRHQRAPAQSAESARRLSFCRPLLSRR